MTRATFCSDDGAVGLFADGELALLQNRFSDALDLFRGCLSRSRAGDDTLLSANTLQRIGFILTSLERYDEALEAYEESLLYREHPDRPAESVPLLTQLGTVYRLAGRDEDAAEAYRRLREACNACGDLRGEGMALSMLGQIRCALQGASAGLPAMMQGLELVFAASRDEADLMIDYLRFYARSSLGDDAFREAVTKYVSTPELARRLTESTPIVEE